MARITVYETSTAEVEVKDIFAEIEGTFGMVPNLFKTYANHVPLLRANWNKVKDVMGEGSLRWRSTSRRIKGDCYGTHSA